MYGALTLVDCAQTVGHIPVDTRSIGCDFLVFSPHKVFAPSGVGGLYIRHEAQPLVRNFRFGGGMVDQVGNEHVRYKSGLARFEAGTPNIEGVIGTGAAIDFVDSIGLSTIQLQNKGLDAYLRDELSKCKFIELPFLFSKIRVPIVTFNVAGAIDLQTLSVLLSDVHGIAVNVGFQCNQPLYQSLGLKGGLRASLHMYNNKSEIDCFVSALNELLS
jgi:cysteine desulfurase/selenocysteine lyase